MLELNKRDFIEVYENAGGKKHWWGYPRGFAWHNRIYINKDAWYLGKRDYRLLIEHEKGHLEGKKHTFFGLMSPCGLVRYFTTWQ